MSSGRTFGALAAAMLASVVALLALGLQTATRVREDVADLDRTRDVAAQVRGVSATLLGVVTSQRGYLLTQEGRYLERYRTGLERLDRELDALSLATAQRPDEAEAVQRLHALADARRTEMARAIALLETQGLGAALASMRPPEGRTPMDDLRSSLETVDVLVAAAQAERHAARAASIERLEQLALVVAVVLVLLLAGLYAMFRREAAWQARVRNAEASARDALERRVAERTAELQENARRLALSEDRLRGIFDSASDGILTADADQVIVDANPASARMFRCAVSDLIGLPMDRLIPPRLREAHRRSVTAFGAGAERARPMAGDGRGRPVTALAFDGEEFPIEASISHTEVAGQRLYTVIHRDITEQRRVAAARRGSEQLLAATFSASSVAMAQIDPATQRFTAVNEALCRLSGHAEAELLGMGPDDLNHPDDGLDAAKLDALMQADAPYREQKRLVRRDGTVLWVEVTGTVVRDDEGQPVRIVGLLQDITARRQAESALRESEARLRFLVHLNDRLRELDDPQTIAFEAASLLGDFAGVERVGYAEDGGDGETILVERNYTRGVPGIEGRYRYADYGPQLLTELRAGRTVVRPDIARDPSLSDDEKAAHARLALAATVNVPLRHDGQLDAVFFVHAARPRDWTADEVHLFEDVALRIRADIGRARAQATVSAARAKLEAALASMNDAVYIADAAGRFVEFNDAFVSFHRFHARGECRRTLAEFAEILDVFLADGTPAPLQQWAVPRALRGEVASSVEYRLRRRDTGESWVGSFSFAPIRAADGHVVGAVVAGRDVTALKRTQEDLASSHATLQHLIADLHRAQEDERKRIARELHDDLQQSLAAIRMDALAVGERLARGRSDVEPLLQRIDRLSGAAIESTRRIVGDLRPEILEELGFLPALEALCDEHALRSGAECRLEVSCPELAARLDDPALSTGLYRIAQEALQNVAKHAEARRVDVHLDCDRTGLVLMRIVDDGVGMREHAPRDPVSFGLLGMAERVRALGGQLRVASEPGRGTTIEVLVPLLGALAPGLSDATGGDGEPPAVDRNLWGRPLQAVIDALDGNVAVLDRQGVIRLVNRAWRAFAARHGAPGLQGCGPGVDYLAVCRRGAADDPATASVLRGLGAVIEGRDEAFVAEYPCDTPDGRHWYRLHAASITDGLTIVSHVDIHGAAAPQDPVPPSAHARSR